jgi:phosphatidate cytidylyltransferase
MILLLRFDFGFGTPESLGRPGLLLCALAIFVSAAAADEFSRLWNKCNAQPSWILQTATVVMISLASVPVLWTDYPADCPIGKFGWTLAGVIAATLISCGYEMWKFKGTEGQPTGAVAERISRSTFAFVYVAMLFGFILPHRLIQDNNHLGIVAIVLLIATVKMSDSFAYFAGKSFGSRKVAPYLSPNKTIEGSLAAPVGGCFAAAIVIFLVAPYICNVEVPKPWWWFLLYGVTVTIVGMIGDLAESLLKRDADCKDSSSWMPGLGGILDVIDSMVFAAPVSFLIWMIG